MNDEMMMSMQTTVVWSVVCAGQRSQR